MSALAEVPQITTAGEMSLVITGAWIDRGELIVQVSGEPAPRSIAVFELPFKAGKRVSGQPRGSRVAARLRHGMPTERGE